MSKKEKSKKRQQETKEEIGIYKEDVEKKPNKKERLQKRKKAGKKGSKK